MAWDEGDSVDVPSHSRHFILGAGLTIEETVLEALDPGSWAFTGAVELDVHIFAGLVGTGLDWEAEMRGISMCLVSRTQLRRPRSGFSRRSCDCDGCYSPGQE